MPKVMQLVTFEIVVGDKSGNVIRREKRLGLIAFRMFGFDWLIHPELEESFLVWEISERNSGRRLPFNQPCLDMDIAIDRAKKYLEEKGQDAVTAAISSFT